MIPCLRSLREDGNMRRGSIFQDVQYPNEAGIRAAAVAIANNLVQ